MYGGNVNFLTCLVVDGYVGECPMEYLEWVRNNVTACSPMVLKKANDIHTYIHVYVCYIRSNIIYWCVTYLCSIYNVLVHFNMLMITNTCIIYLYCSVHWYIFRKGEWDKVNVGKCFYLFRQRWAKEIKCNQSVSVKMIQFFILLLQFLSLKLFQNKWFF